LKQNINNNIEIYLQLFDEGTDVWRPFTAEKLNDNLFRILSINPDSGVDKWQFSSGDIVKCEERQLSCKKCLIAIEKYEQNRKTWFQ
jgi:hypothetical protein